MHVFTVWTGMSRWIWPKKKQRYVSKEDLWGAKKIGFAGLWKRDFFCFLDGNFLMFFVCLRIYIYPLVVLHFFSLKWKKKCFSSQTFETKKNKKIDSYLMNAPKNFSPFSINDIRAESKSMSLNIKHAFILAERIPQMVSSKAGFVNGKYFAHCALIPQNRLRYKNCASRIRIFDRYFLE